MKLEKEQSQSTGKFSTACQALMELAAKLTTLVDGLIGTCIGVAKSYPKVPITFTDLRLSAYRHMGFSTYTGKEKTFFNVYTGKSEKCMAKGVGKTKTGTAIAVQEALARIANAADSELVSELLGWTDQGNAEIAPSLSDLKQFKKAVAKQDTESTVPTKIVGQTENKPAATQWDMGKLDTQLARINTALADSESQDVVDQFTGDVSSLANAILHIVTIKDDDLRKDAMAHKNLVHKGGVGQRAITRENKTEKKELVAVN